MCGASLGGNAVKTSSGIGALDLILAPLTGAGSGGTISSGSGGSWFSNGGTAGTKFGGSSTL